MKDSLVAAAPALDPSRISDWLGGNRSASTLFNALGLMLPPGERFFAESIAAFRERSDDPVTRAEAADVAADDIDRAAAQERYNAAMAPFGGAALEAALQAFNDEQRARKTNLECLLRTAAFAHISAVLSAELLASPRILRRADPAYAAVWRAHARAELEHRAIAFDLLRIATRGEALWSRRRAMVIATVIWIRYERKNIAALLAAQPAGGKRASWAGVLWYAFGFPGGIVRRAIGPYLRYYARDFHPNETASERDAFTA